jgi:hypothetical protein
MALTPNDIGRIVDPTERARAAQQWLVAAEHAMHVVRETRDRAIAAMRVSGISQKQTAELCGLAKSRIGQIDVEQQVRTVRVATIEGVRRDG